MFKDHQFFPDQLEERRLVVCHGYHKDLKLFLYNLLVYSGALVKISHQFLGKKGCLVLLNFMAPCRTTSSLSAQLFAPNKNVDTVLLLLD